MTAKEYQRAYYLANRERLRARRAEYYQKNRKRIDARVKAHRDANRRQYLAWKAVAYAILAGKLKPGPCAVCGLTPKRVNGRNRIEAHHHKGYSRAHRVDVQWLCTYHHKQAEIMANPDVYR